MKDFENIIRRFDIKGTVDAVKPLGNGLINDTYIAITKEDDAPDYVLQRINHHIFTDVDVLQDNIVKVTSHIRQKLEEAGADDIDRKVLTFLPLKGDEKTYYFDGDSYWRVMLFIPRAHSSETLDAHTARYAGEAFGEFQAMLVDIDAELKESIPDFHNIEFRLRQLNDAVAADKAGRVPEVSQLIDELKSREGEMCKAERLYREGKLPKRICHCDTKVNNMMIDDDSRVLCVIDLDTVMPSFIFSDYGDFLRTAANTVAEDDPDLDGVQFDMEIFRAFTEGYLSTARQFLTDIEIESMPYAVALFPYMQAVRFLTDFINGDIYYKIQYPDHNLVRAKNQMRLLQRVEEKIDEMKEFILIQLR